MTSAHIKVTNEDKNIISVLDKIFDTKYPIDLITEKNKRLNTILSNVDVENKCFHLKFQKDEYQELLLENRLYTIGCAIDGTLYNFITRCIDKGPYSPRFSFPIEMTIIDKRSYKRYSTIALSNPYLDIEVRDETHSFMMSDISQGGLSFIIPVEQRKDFPIDKIISIKKIGNKELKENISAKVVHISTLVDDFENQLKVGIQYEQGIELKDH